ncbi:MAG: hypothetical protein IKI29_01980 [Clostridia bacterium]|nr:hypothetical protein [Clostridia bacterium]
MSKLYLNGTFAFRRDTAVNWQQQNPVLQSGEIGIVTDGSETEWLKIGDGETAWNALSFKKGPRGEQGIRGEPGEGKAPLTGTANPTSQTVGEIGQVYLNTTSGTCFICVDEENDNYTWKSIKTYTVFDDSELVISNNLTEGTYYCRQSSTITYLAEHINGEEPEYEMFVPSMTIPAGTEFKVQKYTQTFPRVKNAIYIVIDFSKPLKQELIGITPHGKINVYDRIEYACEVMASGDITGSAVISGNENLANRITEITSSSTDAQYPSAKAVYDLSATKKNIASIVTSGTNITLADNTEYILSEVTDLTLSFPQGDFECWLSITTASSGTINVSIPQTQYIGEKPTFSNGEIWEMSIKNGVVVASKVGVAQ